MKLREAFVRSYLGVAVLMATAAVSCNGVVYADGPGDAKAVKSVDGKYFDQQGNPTYSIKPDGTVDWYTYSGYIRYSESCLRCHGPDGLGSSYAPSLVDALKTMNYEAFLGTVAAGKTLVNTAQDLVMPAFGTDKNVMCVIDDIYVYLRVRSDGALGRDRPQNHEDKPAAATKWQDTCFGP
jgi:methanol metabolism-related c-type cytochrome